MALTIRDLARETGLSTATVSCALRRFAVVKPETRELVLAAAERLGYVRNPQVAQVMTFIRRTDAPRYRETLAFISPLVDLGTTAVSKLYQGARERAHQLGYGLEPFTIRPLAADQRVLARVLRARGIRGLILAPLSTWTNPRVDFPWEHFASVEIGHTLREPSFDRVEREIYEDLDMALQRVLQRGYRRIGLAVQELDEEGRRWAVLARYLVFQQFHPELPVLKAMETGWPWTYEGFQAWRKSEQPDVVVTSHQDVREWLAAAGIKVPDEMGVMRWDSDQDKTDTGLLLDYEDMGACALEMVTRKIELGHHGIPSQPRVLRLGHRWQEGSTLRPLDSAHAG